MTVNYYRTVGTIRIERVRNALVLVVSSRLINNAVIRLCRESFMLY